MDHANPARRQKLNARKGIHIVELHGIKNAHQHRYNEKDKTGDQM